MGSLASLNQIGSDSGFANEDPRFLGRPLKTSSVCTSRWLDGLIVHFQKKSGQGPSSGTPGLLEKSSKCSLSAEPPGENIGESSRGSLAVSDPCPDLRQARPPTLGVTIPTFEEPEGVRKSRSGLEEYSDVNRGMFSYNSGSERDKIDFSSRCWSALNDDDLERGGSIEGEKSAGYECTELGDQAFVKRYLKPMPPQKGARLTRWIHWSLARYYNRGFFLVTLANAIGIFIVVMRLRSRPEPVAVRDLMESVASSTAGNLWAAIIFRNELVINAIFRAVSRIVPPKPLMIRRVLANIYSYGGLHSGFAAMAFAWYLILTIGSFWLMWTGLLGTASVVLKCINLGLLMVICASGLPVIRRKIHNGFEITHRFGGWTLLILMWADLITGAVGKRDGGWVLSLVRTPVFWFLIISTASVMYPWMRTRQIRVLRVDRLGGHAIRVYFPGRMQGCSGVRLSKQPLLENHAFATIPDPEGEPTFSVLISSAGDWTREIVRDPPRLLWMRGGPAYGVIRNAVMFSPVVIVATGSGIGPILGLLAVHKALDCRILWAAHDPAGTYGMDIINAVTGADPQAIIINSQHRRDFDLLSIAYNLYQESRAEAVFCISNRRLTKRLQWGLVTRAVPAYAPIFDS